MPGRVVRFGVVTAALIACTTGCGGGADSSPATASGAERAPQPAASAPAAVNRCPLTAEQVSAAVGAKVTGPNSACMFAPGDDLTLRPNVTFVRQITFACNGTMPAEAGYKEQVPGLGAVVHIADLGDGVHLLVCQGQTPFELVVDAASPELRRNAAIALARQVLAGN